MLGEGIGDSRGRYAGGPKERVFPFVDQWNGNDLVIAEADQPLAQPVLRLGMRQPRRRLFRRVQAWRKFIPSIMPHDLFDHLPLPRAVLAPGRLEACPFCAWRIRSACSAG